MSIKPEWFFEIAPTYFRPESIKNIETRKALQKVEKAFLEGVKKKWAPKSIKNKFEIFFVNLYIYFVNFLIFVCETWCKAK